jgi:hypothetical protein
VSGTTWIWATVAELAAVWAVLETEMKGAESDVIRTVPTGTTVQAGPVTAGVDSAGWRHLIIPLLPGEAFAEDRSGRGVQIWRVTVDGLTAASLVCLIPALNDVFERLALEVLQAAVAAPSPAKRAAEVLATWKELLAAASDSAILNDGRLVGLLGELLVLEELLNHDPLRRVSMWVGADGNQHDFVCGDRAVEVKATTIREGRVVAISSIDQLDAAPARSLHLVVHRFEAAPLGSGETLTGVIQRLLALGVNSADLHRQLTLAGYSAMHDDNYRGRPFQLMERRVYDACAEGFPRIVRSSFGQDGLPAGTLRIRYSIDLTNQPPDPLPEGSVSALWRDLASAVR